MYHVHISSPTLTLNLIVPTVRAACLTPSSLVSVFATALRSMISSGPASRWGGLIIVSCTREGVGSGREGRKEREVEREGEKED